MKYKLMFSLMFMFLIPFVVAAPVYTIGGEVSISGVGVVSGATVELLDPMNGDALIDTTTTNNIGGLYSFSVDAGTYNVIKIRVSGVAGFADKESTYPIIIMGDTNNADFVFGPAPIVDISGKVVDNIGTDLAGVTIKALIGGGSIATTITAGDGTFIVTVLQNNDYTIEASLAGYITETQDVSVLDLNLNVPEDIVLYPLVCDTDLDGYMSIGCGGDDCDDADAVINPGAIDICGNEIDEDCDGSDAVCISVTPSPGPSSTDDSNGGSGPFCMPNWECKLSECINGKQTQTCKDIKECPEIENTKTETKDCVMPEVGEEPGEVPEITGAFLGFGEGSLYWLVTLGVIILVAGGVLYFKKK